MQEIEKDDVEIKHDSIIGDSVIKSIQEWKKPLNDDVGMTSTLTEHHRKTVFKLIFITVVAALIFLSAGVAITWGSYDIGFFEVYQIIWDHFFGVIDDPLKDRIVFELRMPRIVAAIFCGAALAVGGVILQSILRNPLADPYTTGVSSGASLGAVLAITTRFTIASSSWNLILMAFIFSMIPIIVITFVSKVKNASPTIMIMAGIGIMYIFNAITTVLMLFTDPNNLARVYRWQVGTLDNITQTQLIPIIVITLAGLVISMLLSKKLNILATGDDSAKALGIDADKMRIICLILVGFVTAGVVSFTGLIGFVGLVVPHIVRLFIGADNRYLIPASAVLGAVVLITADLIGRSIIAPTILQVGVIMAFLGGPLFLWLIVRKKSVIWG